jgi:hypothetical protein
MVLETTTISRPLHPTYGSWINLVERWLAELTNKRIRRGVFRSVKDLEAAIREYIDCTTKIPSPSFGPKPLTKSWPASLVTPSAQRLCKSHDLTTRITGTGD